jgi:DeoR family fructose operon transcriptional repressor
MLQAERQEQLLGYVNDKKTATIEELSNFLQVSKVTVRRDLDELSDAGLINKIYGGALSIYNNLSIDIPSRGKTGICVEEKKRIGKAAADLIKDGDVIILDSGTTTIEIAKQLRDKKITAITNDLKIAMEITHQASVTLILAGGIVESNVYTTVGHETEKFISGIHVNKSFIGADAFSMKSGITNRTLNEIPIKEAMLHAAEKKILVADHTKLEKEVFATLCPLNVIDTLVIDQIDPQFEKAFTDMGIEIIVA